MLTPKQASDIVQLLPQSKEIYAKRGSRVGDHVKYAYRYALSGPQLRHLSIATRQLELGGATVYVNATSVSGSSYPVSGMVDIDVLERYPKGFIGKTGEVGISAAVAGLSTLVPADNNVYRLRVKSAEALHKLLRWYCLWDGSLSLHKVADPTFAVVAGLDADSLAESFIDAFTGQLGRRVEGGRGISTGRKWFATVYTSYLSGKNVIEVAFQLRELAELLGCSNALIAQWFDHVQQHIGTVTIGHKVDNPWPCVGFDSEQAFFKMLDDWRSLKKSWKLTGKAHVNFSDVPVTMIDRPEAGLPTSADTALQASTSPANQQSTAWLPNSPDKYPVVDDITLQQIRTRRGQAQFRRALIEAYDGKCAFSGCDVLDVLESAHVVPHAQGGSYAVSNGLLLRADLHTLFDLQLICIDENRKIRIADSLYGTMYQEFDGKVVRLPNHRQHDEPISKENDARQI
jgi:hypothetical protein